MLEAADEVASALGWLMDRTQPLGQLYVQGVSANATYLVVAGAVGLLVFLNIVNQLILFAATLTATSTTGQVTDLSAGPRPDVPPP